MDSKESTQGSQHREGPRGIIDLAESRRPAENSRSLITQHSEHDSHGPHSPVPCFQHRRAMSRDVGKVGINVAITADYALRKGFLDALLDVDWDAFYTRPFR